MEKAKAAGLSDVRWIDQPMDAPSWSCRRAEAWLVERSGEEPREEKLGSYAEVATSIADYLSPGRRHGGARGRRRGRPFLRLRGEGRPGEARPRVRRPGARHGAGRLEAGRGGHSLPGLDPVKRDRRRPGPGRVASRPGEGRPERGKDDVRLHPLGARGQSPLGPPAGRSGPPDLLGRSARPRPPPLRARGGRRGVRRGEDRDGRGAPARHRAGPPGDRPDRPPAGGEVLRQRRPVRRRERARDRPHARAPDRRGQALPPAPGHPLLVVRRDPLRVPVLRGPPGRGAQGAREPEPGHGRRAPVGGLAGAALLAHALVAPVVPLRRSGERLRDGRGGKQRLPPRLAGATRSRPASRSRSRSSPASGRASPTTAARSPTSIRPTTSSSTTPGWGSRARP